MHVLKPQALILSGGGGREPTMAMDPGDYGGPEN